MSSSGQDTGQGQKSKNTLDGVGAMAQEAADVARALLVRNPGAGAGQTSTTPRAQAPAKGPATATIPMSAIPGEDDSKVIKLAEMAKQTRGAGEADGAQDAGGAAAAQSEDSVPDDHSTLAIVAAQVTQALEGLRSAAALLGECGELPRQLFGPRFERLENAVQAMAEDSGNLSWVLETFRKISECKTVAEALNRLGRARASALQFNEEVGGYDMVPSIDAAIEVLKRFAGQPRQYPSKP